MKALNELTIVEAGKRLRLPSQQEGAITVRNLWDACSTVAKEKNEKLNAYLEIFEADTVAIASAQKRITDGEMNPLCGIPLAIKDNLLIEGKIASAASKMLEKYVATYDATVIKKLKKAGALFIGRTNMDEFAMGSSTEHSAFGATKNPIDTTRVPGGSSGGSATAVAADMCIAALGSDTGGSIRQPASHTGIIGMKPTYGAVSRSGLIALGSSLDQVGPLTKSVEDAELLLSVIAGVDSLDATTIAPNLFPKREVPTKLCIGVPHHLITQDGVDGEVRRVFSETLKKLTEAGHTLVDITLPLSPYALAAYYIILPAELSTNLSRLDGIRYGNAVRGETLLDDYLLSRTEGFGTETRRRILLGTYILSAGYIDAYYRKGNTARSVLRKEYNEVFEKCDVVAFPTVPAPAFKFGEKTDNPLAMYLEDMFTVTANLTGMPAVSIPMGTVEKEGKQLPIGIHFTAPHQAESVLFAAAGAVEKLSA